MQQCSRGEARGRQRRHCRRHCNRSPAQQQHSAPMPVASMNSGSLKGGFSRPRLPCGSASVAVRSSQATARTPAPPPAASVGPPHTIAVNLPHRRPGACCPASAAQQDGSRLIHPVSQHQRTCRYLRFCDQCRGTGTVLRYACGKAEQQVGKTCQHGQSMQRRQAVQQATKQRWLWKAAVGKVGHAAAQRLPTVAAWWLCSSTRQQYSRA